MQRIGRKLLVLFVAVVVAVQLAAHIWQYIHG